MRALALSFAILTSAARPTSRALQIDGAPFQPTSCRSGQGLGFIGVELSDPSGARVRFAQSLDGTPVNVYFPPGQMIGESLGACAAVHAVEGVAVVNGVKNLEGNATLACPAPHPASGSVQFENCH